MKKKYNYLVGYAGENQCVYGQDVYDDKFETKVASFTRPMTILQAKRALKQLSSKTKKVVYELVPMSEVAIKVLTEMRPRKPRPKNK